jgi:hypothetical protein
VLAYVLDMAGGRIKAVGRAGANKPNPKRPWEQLEDLVHELEHYEVRRRSRTLELPSGISQFLWARFHPCIERSGLQAGKLEGNRRRSMVLELFFNGRTCGQFVSGSS